VTRRAAPESDDLGVVDPIRAPEALVELTRRLRGLPLYALGFLLAAIVRIVLDVADWAEMPKLDPGSGLASLILGTLPVSLLFLIPVAVAWSVQAHGLASSRVIRGSIAVGLSELARMASALILAEDGSTGLAYAGLNLGAAFLLGGGLIWMAHGMEALRRLEPSPLARRAGIGIAASGAVLAVVRLASGLLLLVQAIPGRGSDDVDRFVFMSQATTLANSVIILLGWSYLAWVLIRGYGDADRSRTGTLAGAVSGWLAGMWILASAIWAIALLPWVFASAEDPGAEQPGEFFDAVLIGATLCAAGALAALAWGLANGLGTDAEADEATAFDDEEALGEDTPTLADAEAPTR
jgi:hypothetical protein